MSSGKPRRARRVCRFGAAASPRPDCAGFRVVFNPVAIVIPQDHLWV